MTLVLYRDHFEERRSSDRALFMLTVYASWLRANTISNHLSWLLIVLAGY